MKLVTKIALGTVVGVVVLAEAKFGVLSGLKETLLDKRSYKKKSWETKTEGK